jgi:hypothetical protein
MPRTTEVLRDIRLYSEEPGSSIPNPHSFLYLCNPNTEPRLLEALETVDPGEAEDGEAEIMAVDHLSPSTIEILTKDRREEVEEDLRRAGRLDPETGVGPAFVPQDVLRRDPNLTPDEYIEQKKERRANERARREEFAGDDGPPVRHSDTNE